MLACFIVSSSSFLTQEKQNSTGDTTWATILRRTLLHGTATLFMLNAERTVDYKLRLVKATGPRTLQCLVTASCFYRRGTKKYYETEESISDYTMQM